jgi:uncharacterized protein YndB with AHSA1/START domain
MNGHIARAEVEIAAPPQQVWDALTDPAAVKKYMFGADVDTTWEVGSPITWSGEYEGTAYQDKGEVVAVDEPNRLEVTHFSPLTGQDDVPENYHTLVYALDGDEQGTKVTITQDNNGDQAEADRNSQTWGQMLEALKTHLADT